MFCFSIKKKMLFFLLFITSIGNAQSPYMQGIGEDNEDYFEEVNSFIKKKLSSAAEECDGLEFGFNIWHKGLYNKEHWEAFTHNFLELVLAYNKKNPVSLCPTFLGEPLQTILAVCDGTNGISYKLNIDGNYKNKIIFTLSILRNDCVCDNEPCTCKKFSSKKDQETVYYNKSAWRAVIKSFAVFMKKINTEHPSKQSFLEMYPVLNDIITATDKEPGLHGNFTISIQGDSYYDLEYGLQKDDCYDANDFVFNEDYSIDFDEDNEKSDHGTF